MGGGSSMARRGHSGRLIAIVKIILVGLTDKNIFDYQRLSMKSGRMNNLHFGRVRTSSRILNDGNFVLLAKYASY